MKFQQSPPINSSEERQHINMALNKLMLKVQRMMKTLLTSAQLLGITSEMIQTE